MESNESHPNATLLISEKWRHHPPSATSHGGISVSMETAFISVSQLEVKGIPFTAT